MSSSSGRMDNQESNQELRELGNRLHQRMLAGDVTAFGEIAELMLPVITERLSKKFPNLEDPHLVDTAVVDALLNYQNNPLQYDQSKKRLDNYLYMSARGDLINLLKRYEKDNILIPLPEIVELDDENSEYKARVPEIPSDANVESEVLNKLSPTWRNLRQLFPEDIDQALLMLILDNIRETRHYADILGIADLPIKEQRKIVKQHKDRIKVKLRRNIDFLDLTP